MKKLFNSLFALSLGLSIQAGEVRELTDTQGRKVSAEILRVENGQVRIRVGQQIHDLPLTQLSQEDQTWLTSKQSGSSNGKGSSNYEELIFQDDFSSSDFNARWGHYVSASVIQDGVLIGRSKDIKVHAGVDNIKFEGRKDLEVSVKFKFAGPNAKRFNIWFDDYNYKDAHAGHICSVDFSLTRLTIADAKTGAFHNPIYEKRKSPEGLDAATTEMLKTKSMGTPLKLKDQTWYHLVVRTQGETVTVLIDDKQVAEFTSEGIAHTTKSLVSLTTNESDVHYDDFVIKAAKE